MKFKQNQPWGCGLYAVANACNLDNFITEERLANSNTDEGISIGQLSRYLQDDGLPFSIEAVYYNAWAKKLPKKELGLKPQGENVLALPVLIAVRYSDNSKNHLVGAKIDKVGNLYLYDSLKLTDEMTTLAGLNSLYHHVYGIYILQDLATCKPAFIVENIEGK